jgi:hypothetical protein
VKRRVAALLLALGVCSCAPPGEGIIALEGGTLLDGSGGPPARDAVILIETGHIKAIGHADEIQVPKGAQRISVQGKTIIPGLIDAHATVERWAVPRYLAWGVTTVRDVGAGGDTALAVKNSINLGELLGPRVFTSGAIIDGVPPSVATATGIASAVDARRAADARAGSGADYLAIGRALTAALLAPLAREATTLRMAIAAEPGRMDALTAARGGAGSIELLAGVVPLAAPNPAPFLQPHDRPFAGWALEESGWGLLDSARIAQAAQALAQAHVAIVPGLVQHEMLSRLNDASLSARPTLADVPPAAGSVRDVESLLRRSGWGAADFAAFRRARPRQDLFVREFKRAGGLIAAGTNAAAALLVPGAALHDELDLLVAAGLSNAEALAAATRRAAELLHADSLGRLAPGSVADLVVLNSSPLDDIAATRDIAWVMIRGYVVSPDSLRRTWRR